MQHIHLAATLTVPPGKGPFPGVVLITGSGPQDHDEAIFGHRPFLALADHLTRKSIAVLRADDRGVGKSTGDFAKATTSDFPKPPSHPPSRQQHSLRNRRTPPA